MRNKPKWYSTLLLGVVLLLASSVLGCQAPPLIVEFSATPSEISSGESAILLWSVTEATSINIDQGIDDVSAVGTQTVSPMTTTAYTLTASNAAGTVTKSVVITVTAAPPPPSSFDTYTNQRWGYTISYPNDWEVDSAEPERTKIRSPLPYIGWVAIDAEERSSLPIRDRVQIWLGVEADFWDSVTVLESKEMEGMWDWYVSYDYYWGEQDIEFHAEWFFKDTSQYSYVVEIDFEKAAYDVYPLSEIAETFTLLPESTSYGVVKPTVGYVPQGWYCSDDDPYGTYEESDDGTEWGLIQYTDNVGYDFVMIFYGDVPPDLKGKENDRDALMAIATKKAIFEPTESGTMVVAGELAGWAKAYDPIYDYYEMKIVFVKGSTCVDIYAIYDATYKDEEEAMSLIDSISLRE